MKRAVFCMLILCAASSCFAKARYAGKTEMIHEAEAIAIVNITKIEDANKKMMRGWTYGQKASGTVERCLKGDLKKGKIEIYGDESFICAQCHYEKGRFILFLKKGKGFWVGSNWSFGIRPIKENKVEWFMDSKGRSIFQETPLDKVINDIKNIDRADQKTGLKELLSQFKAAWNSGEVENFMALLHPDSPMKKAYKSDAKTKEKMEEAFAKMTSLFGNVTKTEIRKYIDRKNCFVVRTTYKEKGMIPGTFSLRQEKIINAPYYKWLILDFNVDGKNEPELKE